MTWQFHNCIYINSETILLKDISSYSTEWWEILMHKISSIAVFMQKCYVQQTNAFLNNNKKVSLFLLLNSPSFYLLLYIFYLSLDTFLLCFVFSTSIIQAQIMLTKNAAFCVKALSKKKVTGFYFQPCFF
jgi:hypothetical protein